MDEGRGRATRGTYTAARACIRPHERAHVCTHVRESRVAPRRAAPRHRRRRRRRRRALPPRAQSHVGGRPPSVLKYPGPGEPSSRAAMPLLSMTTTSRARFSSAVLSLYSLFLSLSLSLPPSMHLFPFLVLFVPISFSAPAPPTS